MTRKDAIWLPGVQQTPSTNFDCRPEDAEVDLLVIHNISLPPGEFGGPYIQQLFQNCLDGQAHPYFADICDLKVSAHLLIRRDGSAQQFVPLNQRAWHAGVSVFQGRERCNDFSIGIELEGSDQTPFEPAQYQRLVTLTRQIQQYFPGITPERITGHSDIAPGRKTDPGPHFDWQAYKTLLQNSD